MGKYYKYYKLGYEDGIISALNDFYKSKMRKHKSNNFELKSKLYDSGYIDGYNKFYYIVKKVSFIYK